MRLVAFKFSRTKQVRQYEPERIELHVELEEGDSFAEALQVARDTVALQWGELPNLEQIKVDDQKLDDAVREFAALRRRVFSAFE